MSAVAAAVAAALATGATGANATTYHQRIDFPATGARLDCGAAALTVTGGRLIGEFNESTDGAGLFHYEGTNVASDVTARDQFGASYRIVGTSSFSGVSVDAAGISNVRWRSRVKFTVLRADGGQFGSVSTIERLTGSGLVSLNLGSCAASGGGGD